MSMMRLLFPLCAATLLLFPAASSAGLSDLADKLKGKVQDRIERVEDDSMDAALDSAEERVRCVATDRKCIARAEEEGKEVELVTKKGKPVKQPKAAPEDGEGVAAPPTPRSARAGEGAWANFDFVPGEKVLFADDFSGDRVGNFPKRLEHVHGTMEVVDAKGKRWLRATSKSMFAIPLPQVLPERFTVEMEVTVPWWGLTVYGSPAESVDEDAIDVELAQSFVLLSGTEAGLKNKGGKGGAAVDPRNAFGLGVDDAIAGRAAKLRIHADGRYVKVYLDEHRIANVPNADFKRTNKLYVETSGFPPSRDQASDNIPTLFGAISVNAGGREMYDALLADGRVATQGIYFDTGSDRIRSESRATLGEIVAMLRAHPDLRLRIEGHTDNVGAAAANHALSDRRAAAVKAHLVSAGVAAGRLESKGFGPSSPIAPNTTPEGRQSNRRVELVRL